MQQTKRIAPCPAVADDIAIAGQRESAVFQMPTEESSYGYNNERSIGRADHHHGASPAISFRRWPTAAAAAAAAAATTAVVHNNPTSTSSSRKAPGPPFIPRRRGGNTDTVKLLMMGYRQELVREFTLFNSLGSNMNVLSALSALSGSYGAGIGFTYGGPVVMTWGWIVVMLLTLSVGLSLAEMASAFPTSGALYYWSYKLAPAPIRNLACFLTAWVLTLGQAALSASATYTFVQLVEAAVEQQYGVEVGPGSRMGILVATLIALAALNCGSVRVTAFLTTLGAFWHIIALLGLCFGMLLMAPEREPPKYIFTTWQSDSAMTGVKNPVYNVLLGILMAVWTFTGYDGAAHLAEETVGAELVVPAAMIWSILCVGLTGFVLLVTIIVVKVDDSIKFDPAGNRNMMLEVLVKILDGQRYSSPFYGSGALFAIPVVGAFFCSFQAIANNSRMLYAFSRDGAVPLSRFASRVHPRTRAPMGAIIYMMTVAAVLSIPMCFNAFVLSVVTSFAALGCYTAYVVPVICKLVAGRRNFLPGPFQLPPLLSTINNMVTAVWVCTVMVLFTLPGFYPVNPENCNWSGPMLLGVLVLLLAWYYFPVYGARHWFRGPRANLGQFRDVLPSDVALAASGGTPQPPLDGSLSLKPGPLTGLLEEAEEGEEETAATAATAGAAGAAVYHEGAVAAELLPQMSAPGREGDTSRSNTNVIVHQTTDIRTRWNMVPVSSSSSSSSSRRFLGSGDGGGGVEGASDALTAAVTKDRSFHQHVITGNNPLGAAAATAAAATVSATATSFAATAAATAGQKAGHLCSSPIVGRTQGGDGGGRCGADRDILPVGNGEGPRVLVGTRGAVDVRQRMEVASQTAIGSDISEAAAMMRVCPTTRVAAAAGVIPGGGALKPSPVLLTPGTEAAALGLHGDGHSTSGSNTHRRIYDSDMLESTRAVHTRGAAEAPGRQHPGWGLSWHDNVRHRVSVGISRTASSRFSTAGGTAAVTYTRKSLQNASSGGGSAGGTVMMPPPPMLRPSDGLGASPSGVAVVVPYDGRRSNPTTDTLRNRFVIGGGCRRVQGGLSSRSQSGCAVVASILHQQQQQSSVQSINCSSSGLNLELLKAELHQAAIATAIESASSSSILAHQYPDVVPLATTSASLGDNRSCLNHRNYPIYPGGLFSLTQRSMVQEHLERQNEREREQRFTPGTGSQQLLVLAHQQRRRSGGMEGGSSGGGHPSGACALATAADVRMLTERRAAAAAAAAVAASVSGSSLLYGSMEKPSSPRHRSSCWQTGSVSVMTLLPLLATGGAGYPASVGGVGGNAGNNIADGSGGFQSFVQMMPAGSPVPSVHGATAAVDGFLLDP